MKGIPSLQQVPVPEPGQSRLCQGLGPVPRVLSRQLFLLLRPFGGVWVVSPGCGQQWAEVLEAAAAGRAGQGGHGNSVTWTA